MLKSERHNLIISKVNDEGITSISTLLSILDVSTMTIRRDLNELEEKGLLKKVHGGAQSLNYNKHNELSHNEKLEINIQEKREVAEIAANLIEEEDTIFLGTGTTIELMSDYMSCKFVRIVTNSLPVFEKFKNNQDYEVYLIGGIYRERTGAFVGGLTSEMIQKLKFQKAFIGANAIKDEKIYTANIEEGTNQKIALDNSFYKIIVADSNKLDKEDFNSFYRLNSVDLLIVDKNISSRKKDKYQKYVNIINNIEEV